MIPPDTRKLLNSEFKQVLPCNKQYSGFLTIKDFNLIDMVSLGCYESDYRKRCFVYAHYIDQSITNITLLFDRELASCSKRTNFGLSQMTLFKKSSKIDDRLRPLCYGFPPMDIPLFTTLRNKLMSFGVIDQVYGLTDEYKINLITFLAIWMYKNKLFLENDDFYQLEFRGLQKIINVNGVMLQREPNSYLRLELLRYPEIQSFSDRYYNKYILELQISPVQE